MAIRGAKPKPEGQARHRNKPAHDWNVVENVPFEGAPELPEMRADGRPWRDRTRATWAAWSTMPHCKLWHPSDWSFALDSLELAAATHDGDVRCYGELRARERVMATTFDARRDQRIRYVDAPIAGETPTDVVDIADYRDL